MANLVMVIEVFVTDRNGEHAPTNERAHAVLDQIRRRPIRGSQKHAAAPAEIRRHPPPFDRPKQPPREPQASHRSSERLTSPQMFSQPSIMPS
jgi:hypothetical protein